jgi:hypothetical protein
MLLPSWLGTASVDAERCVCTEGRIYEFRSCLQMLCMMSYGNLVSHLLVCSNDMPHKLDASVPGLRRT